MPIQTDLSAPPYYDDFSEDKNYQRILFKPSVAVQVRELNQLQSILQSQIEKFGDNVYRRGTIIQGCNFIFHQQLPYVKINDEQTDGAPVNVSSFKGFLVKNSKNVIANIIDTSSGFESTPPNLNTIYVKYVTSGDSGSETAFAQKDILTIYDSSFRLFEADIVVKSTNFSNNDTLVVVSAIEVSNTTDGNSFVNSAGQACTFSIGEVITQESTGAQAQIMEVNSTANVQTMILKIRPLASNLRLANTISWNFAENSEISTSSSSITAKLNKNIGVGAFGTIVTDSDGGIKSVALFRGGSGYYVEPWLTVSYRTPNTNPTANTVIDAVRISSKNYLCNVVVNDSNRAIGTGIGISVSDGIIYQKGHFVNVKEQFLVVDPYNSQTNNIVGFDTFERIVNFNIDPTLLDNASGTLNEKAPGADRLELIPRLVVVNKEQATANNDFLPIIEYTLGKPARQRTTTQFNSIAKELAQRTFEQSGNYILDQFLINTADVDDVPTSSFSFRVVADPGTGYIDGYRVQTFAPIIADNIKSSQTVISNTSISINYGNYIRVKQFAGFFNFAIGDKISLRDAAKTYISSSTSASGINQFPVPTAAGNEIGTAKIRSLQIETGTHGSPNAEYRVYLFDVRMNSGKNFKNVRSVFYDGTSSKGVADIALSANNEASIYDVQNSSLLFPSGLTALKNINAVSYTYRTTLDNATIGTNGVITVSVADTPGEYFEYNTLLTADEKRSITLIPLANTQATVNAAGQVIVTGAVANLIGVSTAFNQSFDIGDYIKVANSSGNFEIKRIVRISNATHITVDSAFTNTLGTANAVLFFPQYIPIALGYDTASRRTANVQSNTTLRINIGNTLTTGVSAVLSYDVKSSNRVVQKRVIRNAVVKIDTGQLGTTGPWCLGVPDIIRLGQVYEGRTIEFNGNTAIVNNTSEFITFTNDILVDGEVVLYKTATGNAAITGLTNNQSYFVISANSTGIKLANTFGGSAIDLTATAGNTTQYLLTVSKDDKKVRRYFYIDHNQRKDYYDVGYLYERQDNDYTAPNNTLLLIEYDVLTQDDLEGLKAISSYPINDMVPLARNTAAIHTLEIPEVLHDNGEYFDLRDSLDFRSYTTNTVPITTDINLAPVNPSEPDNNTRFDNQVKKYPVPNSICDLTAEKYLSRIDSVVLLSNTAVKIIIGEADENPRPPNLPKEGLLLNHLIIPPYPSLPRVVSDKTQNYLNNKVINVSAASKKRKKRFTINTPIGVDGLPYVQSKPYTMKDISSLERRISDLEYYTSLSFTEDRVNALSLRSSVDALTNRFKFGFFVDNFQNADFSDIADPGYYAQIYGYELTPVKKQVKIDYIVNKITTISR